VFVVSLTHPLVSPATLFQKIQQGHAAVAFPASMSESARDVICSLLTKEPHLRPTAAQLARDLWITTPSSFVAPPHPFFLCFAPVDKAACPPPSVQQAAATKRSSPDTSSPSSSSSASKRTRAPSVPAEGEELIL
jgi:serine/threonine protein kinase